MFLPPADAAPLVRSAPSASPAHVPEATGKADPCPQLDTATPLNTYIVTTSDYPPPHSPLSTIGGASASGAKRQGQEPLTNVQSLQSSTILNTLANGSASEHADRERHEETSFCTNTRSP
ncbi:hypothetical protein TNCT_264041 [Trichonephila clavata]|uniref:Uncharacterized protein n=1 Tax=Trichonephila clavata TaxID=2740835 RepID=A0A8X6FLZ9_TRICU|nr:hypothetical protein TNCT_264041 [Trichonephila clavata]